MKKVIYCCLVLFISLQAISAVSFETLYNRSKPESTTREMVIGGTIGTEISLGISAITSTGTTSAEGTPFDLLGDDVLLNSGNVGRKIATWTLDSNSNKVRLKVTAKSLKNDGGQEVPYILRFEYSIPDEKTDTFFVVSEFKEGFYSTIEDDPVQIQPDNGNVTIELEKLDSNISISDGEVRVFIPKSYEASVKDDAITPPGTYSARVTIEVFGE